MADDSGARPFSAVEWMMASRYLGSRRRDGFVSVISGISFVGIMLGVAVLIAVMSVMNGFRSELFRILLGVDGHARVYAYNGPLEFYEDVEARIELINGVARVTPFVDGQVLVSTPRNSQGAVIRGIRQSDLVDYHFVSDNIRVGTLDNFQGNRAIAIGDEMSRQLGVTVGDRITLTSPNGDVTPFGTSPRTKSYQVVAIFEMGVAEYDGAVGLLPLEEAQLFFNTGDGVNYLEVMLDDADAAPDFVRPIQDAARMPVFVETWQQRHSAYVGALQMERVMMFMILTLIILVAALNVVSGLVMLAKDKSRGIAVLRTMGATQGMILRIFLIAGARIGVLGTFVGMVLGIVIAMNVEPIRQFIIWVTGMPVFDESIYQLARLPSEINPHEVATVVIVSLVLCLLAPVYPAWRAARLDPVEALRYE